MAAGRKKNNSKNNKNDSRKKVASRIQNALEIAERQMNAPGESDEYVKRSRNAKLNGTIVNPFKKQKNNRDDDDSDDGSKFNYGKDFDIEGSEFEDEEIDSDEAFGSDEDMFDAYDSKFSQTVRDLKLKDKSKRGNQSDSEEDIDPDAYTSIDEDDLMPLSAIWDVNEKVEKEDEDFEKKKKEKLNKNDETQEFQLELNDDVMESESSESESSSDDQNEESDDDIFGKDSDDQEEIDLNTVSKKLQKQVNKGKKPEHRMLSEYNNSLYKEENEFSPFSSKSTNNMNATNNKLDINDLMNVLDADDAKKASLLSVDNTEANKAMAAPLSKSMQEKNERKVAYSITKDEVSKWQDTVQMIRQSEHVDYSKLNEAEGAKKVESSAFIQPSSNVRSVLESKIDKVLTDSNLNTMIKQDSEQLANVSPDNFEELPVAKMTKEELMKRNQEMRLMRELMFREERKAKRIKKIKSKSYRKIKRKELLKNQQLLDEENEDDEDMEDADVKRARERMTLKHKNTSKWARDMVKHGMTKDKETREELEEMLRQGDQLTNRIHGRDDSGKRKGVNSDDEPISLSDLEREQDNATNNGSLGKTGVLGMKFMTDAEQRKKEQNRKELEALRRFENGESDNEDIFEDQFGEGINKAKNQGRRVYTPTAMLSKQELEGAEADAEAVKEVVKEAPAKESKKTVVEKKKEEPKPVKNDTSNPWLDEDSDDEKHVKKSSKVHVIDKDSSKMAKASNKIKKHQDRVTLSDKASNNSGNEMILDIEKNTLNIIDPYAKGQNSGNDAFEEGFQNEDLISQAFAGDDVVSKFDQEKQRVIIDEDDKQVDMTLPGWGGWAGDGVKKTNQKKVMKTVKGIAKKDKRRDKNLKNVIINEKVNKKNLKYQASAVPFPYENKEQYEKSLQIPLGPEWSSSNTYSKAIKPRAIVKKSQVIDPLKKPFN